MGYTTHRGGPLTACMAHRERMLAYQVAKGGFASCGPSDKKQGGEKDAWSMLSLNDTHTRATTPTNTLTYTRTHAHAHTRAHTYANIHPPTHTHRDVRVLREGHGNLGRAGGDDLGALVCGVRREMHSCRVYMCASANAR